MRIKRLVCAPGRAGFFFDDQAAIVAGAEPDGFVYSGQVKTPGFTSIRQAGEAVSVLLVLEDGQIAHGDCAAVQYSGAGGRDSLFLARDFIPVIERLVRPRLEGREIDRFRPLAEEIDAMKDPATGRPLHSALRYGLTQALLDAAAKAGRCLMAEIISAEYGTDFAAGPVPIFAQSGDERKINAEKMILKGVAVIPHGLFNQVSKLGERGELLLEYIHWLKKRIEALKPSPEYRPILHFDVYGTIGLAFGHDETRILDYLARLAEAAAPHKLRIEEPVDMGERERQIEALQRLTARVDALGLGLEIVADEWCNTLTDIKEFADCRAGHMVQIKTPDLGGINNSIEAVLYCRSHRSGAYLGGSSNETDRSAQVCAHIALATSPEQMLAKPGMGVDEGYMIVHNEMQRVLALRNASTR